VHAPLEGGWRYIYLAGTEVVHSPSMHAPQFRRGPRAPVTVSKKGPSVNTSTEYSLAQTAQPQAINFASEVGLSGANCPEHTQGGSLALSVKYLLYR
jgi:hypothetical protein